MDIILAYIDPGSGSLVIQAVIAGLVAVPVLFPQPDSPGASVDPSSWRCSRGAVARHGAPDRVPRRVAVSSMQRVHGTAHNAVKTAPAASREAPSFLPAVGIGILPVVYVLTTYLDQGVWPLEASRAVAVAGSSSVLAIGIPTLLLRDRVHGALVGLCLLAMLFAYEFPGVLVLLGIVSALIALDSVLGSRSLAAASKMLRLAYRLLGVFGFALLGVVLLQFAIHGQVVGYSPPVGVAEADTCRARHLAGPARWLSPCRRA